MRKYPGCLIVLLLFTSFAASSQTTQSSAEPGVRGVLCRIKNRDFAHAQKDLEKILKKEPQNIYAQRLWPGVLAEQLKLFDMGPEDIAHIRKTIDAYQQYLKNSQLSAEERTSIDDFIISLYEKIGEKEAVKELLKRGEDKNRTPQARSKYYVRLAFPSGKCAVEVMMWNRSKPEKPEIEKAKTCISEGLEYINQAIALDNNSSLAWGKKMLLLNAASTIAGFENDQALKDSLEKELSEAMKRSKDFRNSKIESASYGLWVHAIEREKEERKEIAEVLKGFDTIEMKTYSKDLLEYKAEKTLSELVKEIYFPFFTGRRLDDEANNAGDQKREWKNFSPTEEEITAELPDNVMTDSSEKSIRYKADSEGISYTILSLPRLPGQASVNDDAVINTMAWSMVKPSSNFWLLGDSPGSYEIRLVRKKGLGGKPGRTYAFKLGSCSGTSDGILVVLIGTRRNYGIDIRGANEQDPRVRRFLKSVKFE